MSNNGVSKRFIYAFIFLGITIPAFFIIAFGGIPGRIIGLVMLTLIGMVGIYEVLTTAKVSQYIALLAAMLITIYMFLPWNHFYEDLINFDKNTIIYSHGHARLIGLTDVIHMAIGNWQNWLVISIISIIPLITDEEFRESPRVMYRQIIVSLTILITCIFVKSLWVITMFDWTLIFFFLPIAIISDTFAYFGGMKFGKTWFNGAKFAPNVSPKKTWAGFAVGFVFTLVFTITAGYFMHVWKDFGEGNTEIILSVVFGILLSLITPYGDLLFSWFKRTCGKKDFSNLIPGHGGIYDRLDSMSIVIVVSSLILLFAIL